MQLKKYVFTALLITTLSATAGCANYKANHNYNVDSALVNASSVAIESASETINGPDYTGHVQMTGSALIWNYDSPAATEYKAVCKMTVSTGKAKLILIDTQNKVTTLIERDAATSSDEPVELLVPASAGLNRIKLVGKNNADVELSLDLDVGEAHTVDFDL